MSISASSGRPGDDLASSLRSLIEQLPGGFWTDGELEPDLWEEALVGPAINVLSRTGKGFRGRLLEHSWALAGGAPGKTPELLPLSIEILHIGSLVIDDIEDDSSFRRGAPALHRQFGLPIALNTGNWLYFLSFALLSRLPIESTLRLALYEDMSLGLLKCHQGQALDLSVSIIETPRARVPHLVRTTTRLKTGALMGLAATLGARAAGAAPGVVEAVGAFGTEVGVGLQMLDDWSGVNVAARRDKGIEDLRLARPTWPWAWLANSDNQLAFAEVLHKVRDASIDWEFDQARQLMASRLSRIAPESIRSHFVRALSPLRTELMAVPGIEALEIELNALFEAYG